MEAKYLKMSEMEKWIPLGDLMDALIGGSYDGIINDREGGGNIRYSNYEILIVWLSMRSYF